MLAYTNNICSFISATATTFMDSLLFSFFIFLLQHIPFTVYPIDDDENKASRKERRIVKKCFSFLLCFFRTSTNLDDDLKLVYWCIYAYRVIVEYFFIHSFLFKSDRIFYFIVNIYLKVC